MIALAFSVDGTLISASAVPHCGLTIKEIWRGEHASLVPNTKNDAGVQQASFYNFTFANPLPEMWSVNLIWTQGGVKNLSSITC